MLELKNIKKEFKDNNKPNVVLKDINIKLPDTGLFFLVGKSGEGKSTLLNIIGGILSQTSGDIVIDGKVINNKTEQELREYRKNYISFVFQDNNLINDFSVMENLTLSGCEDKEKLNEVLSIVGLEKRVMAKVSTLSGGERQRLALARGLLKKSSILLLDEPTGSLDRANAINVMENVQKISKFKLVLVVSHDIDLAREYADDIYVLSDGIVKKSYFSKTIMIDKLSFDTDEFIKLCNSIKKKNIDHIYLNREDKIIKLDIDVHNVYSSMKRVLKKYLNTTVEISIEKNKDRENTMSTDVFNLNSPVKFSFKKQLNYAFILFKKHILRSIASIVTLSICVTLIFLQLSMSLSDVRKQINDSFSTSNIKYAQVIKGDKDIEQNGYDFYTDIANLGMNDIYHVDTLNVNGVNLRIFCLDKDIIFNGVSISSVEGDNIVVTSFAYDHIDKLGDEATNYNLIKLNDTYDNDIFTRYEEDPNELKKLNLNECDTIQNSYLVGFVNPTYYKQLFCVKDYYEAYSSLTRDYLARYKNCENLQQIDYGRNVKNEDEIVVTTHFIKYFINEEYQEDYSLALGITLSFAFDELYWDSSLIRNKIDVSKIFTKKVKIVGIEESNRDVIYFNNTLEDKFIDQTFYMSKYVVNVEDDNNVNILVDNAYGFNTSTAQQLKGLNYTMKDTLFYIFLIVECIVLLISLILLGITCTTNVKENIKQICIIKSMGFKNSEMVGNFNLLNTGISLFSLLLGIIFSIIGVYVINETFKKPTTFNIGFSLLSLNWLAFVCIAGGLIIISLLFNLISTRKIKKVDLVNFIRE